MLSDTNLNQQAVAGTAAAIIGEVSSFSTKFNVLKFHSDKKSLNRSKGTSKSKSSLKNLKVAKKVSCFDAMYKE